MQQQHHLIQVKELSKGVESIVEVDWKHPEWVTCRSCPHFLVIYVRQPFWPSPLWGWTFRNPDSCLWHFCVFWQCRHTKVPRNNLHSPSLPAGCALSACPRRACQRTFPHRTADTPTCHTTLPRSHYSTLWLPVWSPSSTTPRRSKKRLTCSALPAFPIHWHRVKSNMHCFLWQEGCSTLPGRSEDRCDRICEEERVSRWRKQEVRIHFNYLCIGGRRKLSGAVTPLVHSIMSHDIHAMHSTDAYTITLYKETLLGSGWGWLILHSNTIDNAVEVEPKASGSRN